MNPIEGFVSELTLRIENQSEAFAAPVVFVDTDMPIVLGREGFFDKNSLCIFHQLYTNFFEILAADLGDAGDYERDI